ncbi:apolipoprotein N-acyltransferase [Hoeflea sp. YIM 152468]|uniref:apolipoprotein N-acyltransferase n=1 Tax=Hoeflea sp. YIM 152468 TaxID=3031759 RepID=UPI0023DAC90B|nr:apolipoprotein N-acyltransferase [Hoeflea sp. YIM 152468]MDF1610222.1 apolipoprotein N-acyltransferase [Hoeflea sp. YIM 152468]
MERIAESIMLSWGGKRMVLAFGAGALAVLALPPFNFFAVLFVSFPVLVWLLDGASGSAEAGIVGRMRPAFATGWWFGFGYFVAGLWWLGNALLVDADGFAWALPLAVLGLPALLAIFYGAATALAWLLWSDGVGRVAALAAAFGVTEWARGFVLTGFPWNAIGYAAMPAPLMMQSAEIVGIFGMSALTVFVFSAPALLGTRRGAVAGMVAALLLFSLHIGYGWLALHRIDSADPAPARTVVRIVQPAIDQSAKWDMAERERIFARLLQFSAVSPRDGAPRPTHIVWPETALPFLLTENPGALSRIAGMLQVGQTLVTGAVRFEDGIGGAPQRFYNTIYVIDDEGQIIGSADKAHLVPFGEYLPFERLLRRFGLAPVAETFGGFSAADHRTTLSLSGGLNAVPLICYEAIFPGLSTLSGSRGDLLLNLTNDAWYGMTPGPYQHLRQAQLRAVETRLPLVRAANSGISAVIDAGGRVVGGLPLGEAGVFDVALPPDTDTVWSAGNRRFSFGLIIVILAMMAGFARRSKIQRFD